MKRRVAILAVLLSLLATGSARAASIPGLMPELLPAHLLTQVGVPAPPPTPFRSGFSLRSKGYKVKVFTYGSSVNLEVSRGSRKNFAATAYLARGVAVPDRLQATFGRFGKVSMRFQPPRQAQVRYKCVFGERLAERLGSYVGQLRFRGEGGYLTLDVHRAKGSILTLAGRCHIHRHFTPKQIRKAIERLFEPVAGVLANSRDGVATTTFVGLAQRGRTAFYAVHKETHGKLALIRFALVRASKGFHANEAVTAVEAAPPAPFHGTGHYRAAPDGTSTWTGPLSVDFPGARHFPLTGPSFETFLEVPF
jgi:hypothetical protein